MKFELTKETVCNEYKDALNALENELIYYTLQEMSYYTQLSVNTIQNMRKGKSVSAKSWIKLRKWQLKNDLE